MSVEKFIQDPSQFAADVNRNTKNSSITIYGYPTNFTPLALASFRGWQELVIKELKSLSKSNNISFIDSGYKNTKNNPIIHDISPLQLSCAMYINTRKGCYLNIIKYLISFGANIHNASYYIIEPSIEYYNLIDNLSSEYKLKQIELNKKEYELNLIKNKKYNKFSDQNERLNNIKIKDILEDEILKVKNRMKEISQRAIYEKKKNLKRKIINLSPYMLAIKDRQTTNDTILFEYFVYGATIIKNAISKTRNDFDDGLSQIIVEYIIGLPLRIWEIV